MPKCTVNAKKCLTYSTRDLKCASKSNPWYNCDCFTWEKFRGETMNSRLHFKISTSSFQMKLFCLCTRALRGNRLHRPFRAATGDIFHPFHLGRQHPESPTPPHRPPAFHSTTPPNLHRQLPPPPDPQQNPFRCRRAQPGHVPTLRRQPYLHCRSQHAAARASPSSFAHQPPLSITMQ